MSKVTHEIVDFGIGKLDSIRDYPFQGTEEECSRWLDKHNQTKADGKKRYGMQEIPKDFGEE